MRGNRVDRNERIGLLLRRKNRESIGENSTVRKIIT